MAVISSAPRRPAGSDNTTTKVYAWNTRLLLGLLLMAFDAIAVNSALIGVYIWRFVADDLASQYDMSNSWPSFALYTVLVNLVFMATFFVSGLYTMKRGVSRVDEAIKVVLAVSLGTFAAYIANGLLPLFGRSSLPLTATIAGFCWVAAILVTILLRVIYHALLRKLRLLGFDIRRVLIVGARDPGRLVNRTISRSPELGYRVQGFLSEGEAVGNMVDGIPVLGRPGAIGRVIRATQADEVIIALSNRASIDVLEIVALAEDEAVEIKLYPDTFQLVTNNDVSVGDVSGLPLLSVKNVALDNPVNQMLKRMLDVVVAGIVLTMTAPVMLLIALLIKLESPGPVFFVQERVGLDGKPFPVIKFRGMRHDAPQLGTWTTRDDPRVTKLGAFLRRYSVDELPQFINVLRGEMSIVGPRPEQPVWVERFSQSIPRYMRRHKQKAGITGWAQVNGLRGDTSIEERTRYDLYYVHNWSLLFDLKIIIKTAVGILTGNLKGY